MPISAQAIRPAGPVSRRRRARRSDRASGRPGAAPESRPTSGSPTPPALRRGRVEPRGALGALALAVLVAVAFLPALQAGFVWDDEILFETEAITVWSGLRDIWLSPRTIKYEGHYWPLPYSTFWLEHKLWGFDPTGYHVVNLALHLAVCLLFWRLLRRLSVPGAWLAAALFAVHPVHVEVAVWIFGRKDLLCSLLYACALLTWLRYEEEPGPTRYAGALLLFAAALLAKSMAITLPAALLILQWWRRGRPGAADLARLAPFFVLGLAIAIADKAYYDTIESARFDTPAVERALRAAQSLWFYLGKLLWPTEVAGVYPFWDPSPSNPLAWAALLAWPAVLAVLWRLRGGIGTGPLIATLYFIVTLSPTLGLVDFGYLEFAFAADRYQYLGSAGIIALAGAVAAKAADSLRARSATRFQAISRRGPQIAAAALLAVLGALTWQHAAAYRDSITFYEHVLEHNPTAHSIRGNLGGALIDSGRLEEGLSESLAAIRQDANDRNASTNAGRALLSLGRFDEAERHLLRSLELHPRDPAALFHLGALTYQQGRFDEAVRYLGAVAKLEPGDATNLSNLGAALLQSGRIDEGRRFLQKGLALDPSNESALHNLELLEEKIRLGVIRPE